MLITGSPSLAAWSVAGFAAAKAYGRLRADRLEGLIVSAPASGEAELTDAALLLHLLVVAKVGGTIIRGGTGERSVEMEIPYRLIRGWGTDAQGLWMDVVGRGALRLQPQDRGELAQWLAHLSQGRTWQPPIAVSMHAAHPVVGWCQQDPRFTFALPEQWITAHPRALADYAPMFQPRILRVGVLLEAGQWQAQVFVIEADPVEVPGGSMDVDSLAATLASATNISLLSPVMQSTVGGEPAALLRGLSSSPEGAEDRCYVSVAHRGILWAVWYGVVGSRPGDGAYESWEPHFRTMLASWHWYACPAPPHRRFAGAPTHRQHGHRGQRV